MTTVDVAVECSQLGAGPGAIGDTPLRTESADLRHETKVSSFSRQVYPGRRRQLPTGLRERSGRRVQKIRRSFDTPALVPTDYWNEP